MDTETTPPHETAAPRRRGIMASLKGLFFTMMVLAALWFAMRYVLTPLVLPKPVNEAPMVSGDAEERIRTLEEKVAVLENKTVPPADFSPLEARIAVLEKVPVAEAAPAATHEDIEALKAEVQKLKSTNHGSIRSLILIGQLQDAIRAGRPFASEVTTLVALRPDMKEMLAPLTQASFTGIATFDGLKIQFAQAIAPALAPTGNEKSLTQNLRSLVKIRKVGEGQKGQDDDAIIARAEAKLAKGDVAAALQETSNLSPRAAKGFSAWQERAETYLAAQGALAALQPKIAAGAEQ